MERGQVWAAGDLEFDVWSGVGGTHELASASGLEVPVAGMWGVGKAQRCSRSRAQEVGCGSGKGTPW